MSSCKEQSRQPSRKRPQVEDRFWLAELSGWRPLFCHQWIGGKRNISLPNQPTKLYLHNADFVRNYANEFSITFTPKTSPNTTSLLTRSASYSDIVVENTEKIRNLRIIFISYCIEASSLINRNVNFDMCISSLFLLLFLNGNVSSLAASMEKKNSWNSRKYY